MYDVITKLRIYTYQDLEKMFDIELDILEAMGEAARVILEREGRMNDESYTPEAEKRFDAIIDKYSKDVDDDKVMTAFGDILASRAERLNQMAKKIRQSGHCKNVWLKTKSSRCIERCIGYSFSRYLQ